MVQMASTADSMGRKKKNTGEQLPSIVKIERDQSNTKYAQMHCFRLTCLASKGATKIVAEVVQLLGSNALHSITWHASKSEVWCVLTVDQSQGLAVLRGSRKPRYQYWTTKEVSMLKNLYLAHGIQACFKGFAYRSHGSILSVLNRMGIRSHANRHHVGNKSKC